MQAYKPVTKQDVSRLRRYYQNCSYGLCEYSVGTKLMWRKSLHPAWAEIAGCLVIRNEIDGEVAFDYPVPAQRETRTRPWRPSRTTAWSGAFPR